MSSSEVSELMYEFFILCVRLAGPSLIASMVVGVVISIIQAATQIHEQTVTFVPKLLTIGIVLLLTGGHMMEVLRDFTEKIFQLIQG